MNLMLKCALIFILFYPAYGISQVSPVDEIILKNGQSFSGIIIEQRPGKYIKLLELPSQDTLVLLVGDIKLMRRIVNQFDIVGNQDSLEVFKTEMDSMLGSGTTIYNQRSLYLSIGGSIGGGSWSNIGINIKVFHTLMPKLQVGIGAAFLGTYKLSDNPTNFTIPLTAELRYHFQGLANGRSGFLMNLSTGVHFIDGAYPMLGYNYAILQNGFYLQPGLAYRFNFTKNMGGVLDLSYQMIRTTAKHQDVLVNKHTYSSILASFSIFL